MDCKLKDKLSIKEVIALGQEIKRKRLEMDITQKKLAELAGLHRNYISYIENAKIIPTIESLDSISKALNLNSKCLIELIGGE